MTLLLRGSAAYRLAVALGVAAAILLPQVLSQAAPQAVPSGISLPTEFRVHNPGWWPTKGEAARADYVGDRECAKCHAEITGFQRATSMAQAASRIPDSSGSARSTPPPLSFHLGPYQYDLAGTSKSILTVRSSEGSGTPALSEELLWSFGQGRMGQTYLYEQDGRFYEAHVSLFAGPRILDITPGQSHSVPKTLEEAAGRRMPPQETQHCFACHTTASTTENKFDTAQLMLGVSCEGCHGPGLSHTAAAKAGVANPGLIMNPHRLDPVDSVDFCGACHRTWQDVVGGGLTELGIANVRFAPYRLENSACWKNPDSRLTCVACHDPHRQLVTDDASYDVRCLACHLSSPAQKKTADHPGRACRVSTKNCVTCHMPKYEPANLHSSFTDHWIRIVRSGKPYPP